MVAVANAGCGAHGNCAFLVFRQESLKDVLILDSVANDWDFLNTRHRGYRDIELTNGMGVHTVISIWQYDGEHYQTGVCYDKSTAGAQVQIPLNQCS